MQHLMIVKERLIGIDAAFRIPSGNIMGVLLVPTLLGM